MYSLCKKIVLVFILTFVFISLSSAQRVQPMVFELSPVGSDSSTTMNIENTTQKAVTVEILASKITAVDEASKETLVSADEDFLIFPPQTLIAPGKSQNIRVKYIGNPKLSKSQGYRILIKQLPVDMSNSGTSGVGMVVNFSTLLNIVPKNTEYKLKSEKLRAGVNGKWELIIENKGNRFVRLSKSTLEISNNDGSNKKILTNKQISDIFEVNYIPPGAKIKATLEPIAGYQLNNIKFNFK